MAKLEHTHYCNCPKCNVPMPEPDIKVVTFYTVYGLRYKAVGIYYDNPNWYIKYEIFNDVQSSIDPINTGTCNVARWLTMVNESI
jgi:hypothetical protein